MKKNTKRNLIVTGLLIMSFIAGNLTPPIAPVVQEAIANLAPTIPAFPGAEGFGSKTAGGRGGQVIKVTNLNDSGAGSLRAALTASGARIVVFTVGGTITLNSNIKITNPYLTVAGQTAPGDGILIRGQNKPGINGNSADGSIWIDTHDVIIRGLRIRGVNRTAIGLYAEPRGSIYNIIIDHNSLSWSTDSVSDNWYNPHDVTYSWNIIAEPVGEHNYGMLIGGFGDCTKPGGFFTVHHNIFSDASDRNPRISQGQESVEVVNNLIYNWYWFGTRTGSEAAIVGNQYIAGPDTVSSKAIFTVNESCFPLQSGDIFVSHNIGPGRTTDNGDDWNIVSGSTTYRANAWPFVSSGVSVDDVSTVQAKLFAGAGAIVPKRDAVDVRIISEIQNKTGGFVSSPDNLVWPVLSSGPSLSDSDNDGLPDSFDAAGRNPSDTSPTGYTYIEDYINSFYASVPVTPAPATLTQTDNSTATRTPTASPTFTPTKTATPTQSPTASRTATRTVIPPSDTATPSLAPVSSSTFTPILPTATSTPSKTATFTLALTFTPSATDTMTPPPPIILSVTPTIYPDNLCAQITWNALFTKADLSIRPSASLSNTPIGWYEFGKVVTIEAVVTNMAGTWAQVNRSQFFALKLGTVTYSKVVTCLP